MRLLLDTHAFLWWELDAPTLSAAARAAISDAKVEVWVSAVSVWEIVIKRALGRIEFPGSLAATIAQEGFGSLPFSATHADAVASLPTLHNDPFDRALIAQAKSEALTLVTHDEDICSYEGFDVLLT